MSISKEKSGYKVRYRIGTKQYSKSGFRTKREAEAYEAEQLRKEAETKAQQTAVILEPRKPQDAIDRLDSGTF